MLSLKAIPSFFLGIFAKPLNAFVSISLRPEIINANSISQGIFKPNRFANAFSLE
jgi:hypothetical protein